MKTLISKENPFGFSRYGFAFENIGENFYCLDYGCYDGNFMRQVLNSKNNIEFIGVDKNNKIIEKNPHSMDIRLFSDSLPFENETFDFVSILDVIEHIYDQNKTLAELNRVLKFGATLVVTVPKKNIFSFLDLGNLKFIFPRLHKFYYVFRYSKDEYESRYLNNPSGLIGDVEKEKAWHQHFSKKELESLLEINGFSVEKFDGSGLFQRFFALLDFIKLGSLIPKGLRVIDSRAFESSNLFCKAKKINRIC